MPISLITGPTGSGKTRKILEQMDLCVVPTESIAFEHRQILLENNDVLLGDTALPFHLFIKKIADTKKPVISLREQTLLLYHLLAQGCLNYFKSASYGVAKEAARTITILKKNFISPLELNRLLSKNTGPRERDLCLLYEKYEKEKEHRGVLDDGDLFFIAAKKFKDENVPLLENIKYLAFDEFSYFTPGQISLLETISQNLKDKEIIVSLSPYAPYLENTFKILNKISSKTYAVKKDKNHADPKIKNLVLRSSTQETQFIVKEIAEAVNSGVSPERIGICLRMGDPRIFDILEGLKDAGIAPTINAPVVHEILSETITASLPAKASIFEYSNTLRKQLRSIHEKTRKHSSKSDRDLSVRRILAFSNADEILKSLSATSQTLHLDEVPRETFSQIFFEECSSFFAAPSHIDSICPFKLINFEDGMTQTMDIVFVPQAIEGYIPSPPRENLFFAADGQKKRNDKLADIFPDSSFYLAFEAFSFKRLISKITKKVIITHPAIDDRGKETAPSSFLDPFGKALPCVTPLFLKEGQSNLSFIKHLSHVINIERERSLGIVSNPSYHGHLEDKEVRSMIKERFEQEALSPTQIETYAGCPFRFFAENVLNLRALEEITPEIQPQDLGTIIHAILERFYRKHPKLFKQAVTNSRHEKEIKNVVNQIVDEVFKDYEKKISYTAAGLRPYEKKLAHLMSLRVIIKELETARSLPEPLFPYRCEWVFGKDHKNLFKLDLKGKIPALIKGRIDRIDVSKDQKRFAIIDYKTSKNVGSIISKIKKGLHVQLPLYVEAAKKLLLPKAIALGGVLLAVKKAEKKHGFLKKDFNNVHYSVSGRMKSILDDDIWEEILQEAIRAAKKHIEAIRKADFKIKPNECPKFCDYVNVCRYNKKEADHLSTKGN